MAGAIADFHFAPTQAAKINLLREGIAEDSVSCNREYFNRCPAIHSFQRLSRQC